MPREVAVLPAAGSRRSREPGEDDGDEGRHQSHAPKGTMPNNKKSELAPRAILTSMDKVRRKPIRWLWHGRIANGKLTILDGDPGVGKSTVAFDIAARISKGHPMPGEKEPAGPPADVVLISVEDDEADTIKPRLEAAGADCRRIHTLRIRSGTADLLPVLESWLPQIEEGIRTVSAKLLILDPLAALLGDGVDMHKDQAVRSVLSPLTEMAQRRQVAVLAIRHFNKTGGTGALHRGGGSIGISANGRSVLAVGRDPSDPKMRVLAAVKSNVAEIIDVPSLSYRIDPVRLPPDQDSPEPVDTTRIEWVGTSSVTADELVAASPPATHEERSELEQAKDVVNLLLSNGSLPSKEFEKEALAAGVSSSRTLDRARRALGVKSRKTTKEWVVFLPDAPSPILGGLGVLPEDES